MTRSLRAPTASVMAVVSSVARARVSAPRRKHIVRQAARGTRSRCPASASSEHTTTPGGRLVFHVFAALAEFIVS
jgi:hypothetical protein